MCLIRLDNSDLQCMAVYHGTQNHLILEGSHKDPQVQLPAFLWNSLTLREKDLVFIRCCSHTQSM